MHFPSFLSIIVQFETHVCSSIISNGSSKLGHFALHISEVLSTNSSSIAEESISEESNLVIHCDTSNVLANEYYKSFIYGDGEDQIVKAGWVIPKGKYRIDVVNTKAWVQVSIYVAESGTVEPTTTEKNKTPLLLKKEETAVIEVDGNEYIYDY